MNDSFSVSKAVRYRRRYSLLYLATVCYDKEITMI